MIDATLSPPANAGACDAALAETDLNDVPAAVQLADVAAVETVQPEAPAVERPDLWHYGYQIQIAREDLERETRYADEVTKRIQKAADRLAAAEREFLDQVKRRDLAPAPRERIAFNVSDEVLLVANENNILRLSRVPAVPYTTLRK